MLMSPPQARTQSATTPCASRTLYASLAVNLVLMALQIGVGGAAHSDGLLADGVHTLVDLLADGLILLALRLGTAHAGRARSTPPYETLAALALGALLIGTGLDMLWHALERLSHAPTLLKVDVSALCVAVFALVAKETLFRCMMYEAKRTQSALLQVSAWHARADAVSALLVLVGIAGSLAGFLLLDEVAAALIGLMVLRLGSGFARNAWHALGVRPATSLS